MVDHGATSWQELQPETTPSAAPHGRRPPHACGQVNPGDPQATPSRGRTPRQQGHPQATPKGEPQGNPWAPKPAPNNRAAPQPQQPGRNARTPQQAQRPSHTPDRAGHPRTQPLTKQQPHEHTPAKVTLHSPRTHGDAASRRNPSKDDRRSTPTQQRNARHPTQPGTDWRDVGEEGVWGRVRGGVARGVGGVWRGPPPFACLPVRCLAPLGLGDQFRC